MAVITPAQAMGDFGLGNKLVQDKSTRIKKFILQNALN